MPPLAFTLGLAATLCGAAPDHAVVPGFERFYAADKADERRGGELLLGELNCVACHAAEKAVSERLNVKKAPHLDQVGSRVRTEFLREFIANPQHAKAGSTMPNVFAGVADEVRRQQVEALVHFLSLTGNTSNGNAVGQAVKRGEQLFHTVGCAACHDGRKADSVSLATSVPIDHVGKKYSIPSLTSFLIDPLAVRPSGRMPHLNLKPDESRDIANYLLNSEQASPNLKFSYYEGNWDKLPDFSQLKPMTTGTVSGFEVNVGRSDNFAIRFEGFLQIATEGQYRFFLSSDDGSRLTLDGEVVVTNDGIHPPRTEVGRAFLTKGPHALIVDFFEGGGGEEVTLEIEGGGIKQQSVEFALTLDREPKNNTALPFAVDPALAEQGRQLFAKLGCVNCHQLGKEKKPADEFTTVPTLAKLNENSTTGCLAAQPKPGVPRFALNDKQRRSLVKAVAAVRAPAAPSPQEQLAQTLTAFNCFACHQRGELGGVEEPRNAFFQSNQQEMGDEGRLPPTLTGVGAKLKPEWLKHIFDQGAKERPYMFTRMPRFGSQNVGTLVAALGTIDSDPQYTPVVPIAAEGKMKGAGRKFVGGQGLSCIKCHTWGNVPATGIQAISMTTMTQRLKEGWFHHYIFDPQVVRPGTRMPQAWPQGQTFFQKDLDGDVQQQIHAVWMYLKDGDKATIPLGLGRDPIELIATTEPVIYRNFIEGAGSRAIGVGYPEKLNLAFDANEMRLALLWQGAFIDAARHWTDRGVGYQPPLGDNVLRLPTGPEFALLEKPDTAWPNQKPKELGFQFRGYRLDDKRQPTFTYTFQEILIDDQPVPIATSNAPTFGRQLRLKATRPIPNLWFRAATAPKIDDLGQGWFSINGEYKLRLQTTATPLLRESNGKKELLVPVPLQGQPAQLLQEFAW